jgi:hypothetical protein
MSIVICHSNPLFIFSETRYLAEQERLLSGEIKRMPKFPLIDTPWVDHQDEVWFTFAFLRSFQPYFFSKICPVSNLAWK